MLTVEHVILPVYLQTLHISMDTNANEQLCTIIKRNYFS